MCLWRSDGRRLRALLRARRHPASLPTAACSPAPVAPVLPSSPSPTAASTPSFPPPSGEASDWVTVPRSVFQELTLHLERLETLELRESMRVVRRQARQQAR